MQNWKQPGKEINCPAAPAALTSGDPVKVGGLVGFTTGDVAQGKPFVLLTEGVVECRKATGEAWAFGTPLYLKAGTKDFTISAAGNAFAGHAVTVQGNADVVGEIRLAQSGPTA